MRKFISIVIISLSAIIMLFVLTACNSNSEEINSDEANVEETLVKTFDGYSNVSISSKIYGCELTINYPNDDSVTTSNKSDDSVTLSKSSENLKVTISMEMMSQEQIDEDKERHSKYGSYKEITYGNYSGWGYSGFKNMYAYLILGDVDEEKIVAKFNINLIDSSNNSTFINDALDLSFIMDIGEHLVLDTKAEKYDIDGTMNGEGTFYLKTIDSSLFSNLTIKASPYEDNLLVTATDSNGSKVKIEIDLRNYETAEKALSQVLAKSGEYIDTTVGEYKGKVCTIGNYSRIYFIEKDSKVYYINYNLDKEFSVDIGDKLLEEVIKNLTLFIEQ